MPPEPVPLSSIRTITELFADGTLRATTTAPRYAYQASSLDRVSLWQGDITTLQLDAIVNAAKRSLLGGGGIDGAIHRAAGRDLLRECRTLGGCETGNAKITGGYNLPARHVIHAVGPVYSWDDVETAAAQLASCYTQSLRLAVANSLKHIAFPAISTGIYGYPIVDATSVALDAVRNFLDSEDGEKLDRIVFVVFTDEDKGVYQRLIPQYFPGPPASPKESTSE